MKVDRLLLGQSHAFIQECNKYNYLTSVALVRLSSLCFNSANVLTNLIQIDNVTVLLIMPTSDQVVEYD